MVTAAVTAAAMTAAMATIMTRSVVAELNIRVRAVDQNTVMAQTAAETQHDHDSQKTNSQCAQHEVLSCVDGPQEQRPRRASIAGLPL